MLALPTMSSWPHVYRILNPEFSKDGLRSKHNSSQNIMGIGYVFMIPLNLSSIADM